MKRDAHDNMLSVGQVAVRSGMNISAIHFYEAKGLIQSVRNAGNQRRYTRDVLRRLAVIRVANSTGLSLASIGSALATLPEQRTPDAADWRRLSSHWREELDARINRLTQLRDQLSGCIGCGCLSLARCPLRNAGDKLAEDGSGPRLLDADAL